MSAIPEAMEQFVEQEIRPTLRKDGGDIQLLSLSSGVLLVKMLGKCSNCPSAHITLKEFVEAKIKSSFPDITSVDIEVTVDEDLFAFAKKILNKEIKL